MVNIHSKIVMFDVKTTAIPNQWHIEALLSVECIGQERLKPYGLYFKKFG